MGGGIYHPYWAHFGTPVLPTLIDFSDYGPMGSGRRAGGRGRTGVAGGPAPICPGEPLSRETGRSEPLQASLGEELARYPVLYGKSWKLNLLKPEINVN
jgi:hypothetical protein